MSINEITLLVVNLLLLCVVWRLVARSRRERFRYRIRMIRDDLFDFMWRNGHDFDTPAYREARQILNGILRMSNFMTPFRFLVISSFRPRPPHELQVECVENEQLRQKIGFAYHHAYKEWIRSLFLSGAFGVAIRCGISVLETITVTRRALTRIKSKIDAGEAESLSTAYRFGAHSFGR